MLALNCPDLNSEIFSISLLWLRQTLRINYNSKLELNFTLFFILKAYSTEQSRTVHIHKCCPILWYRFLFKFMWRVRYIEQSVSVRYISLTLVSLNKHISTLNPIFSTLKYIWLGLTKNAASICMFDLNLKLYRKLVACFNALHFTHTHTAWLGKYIFLTHVCYS